MRHYRNSGSPLASTSCPLGAALQTDFSNNLRKNIRKYDMFFLLEEKEVVNFENLYDLIYTLNELLINSEVLIFSLKSNYR